MPIGFRKPPHRESDDMVLERDLAHVLETPFTVDQVATDRFRRSNAYLGQLREKADGSYSRALAETIFGAPEELVDRLGWGK